MVARGWLPRRRGIRMGGQKEKIVQGENGGRRHGTPCVHQDFRAEPWEGSRVLSCSPCSMETPMKIVHYFSVLILELKGSWGVCVIFITGSVIFIPR